MKKFFSEFKTFALRGNVIDLAVGVIIGAAFQAIVNSLVNDILNPMLGLLFQADFSELTLNVNGVDIKYGSFISAVIQFFLMSLVIFTIIKLINNISEKFAKKLHKEKEAEKLEEAARKKKCPFCKSEIDEEATRCPFCTSELKTINTTDEQIAEKITEK